MDGAAGPSLLVFNSAGSGAAARFLAVLPVVLVWSDWPDSAPRRVVMEGKVFQMLLAMLCDAI
jgi:hypothetical protein